MSQPNPGSKVANINDEDRVAFKKLIDRPIQEKYQGVKNAVAKYIARPESNAFGLEGLYMVLKLIEIKSKLDGLPPEKTEAPKIVKPKNDDNPFSVN